MKPTMKDNGSHYSVRIINEFGQVVSNRALLSISSGPVFLIEPPNINVLRDKEAKFECVVKSNPKPNIFWLFNGKEIINNKDGYRLEKDISKDKYILIVNKVNMNNIGTYTCRACNQHGLADQQCTLDVLELPKIISKLDNVTVNENEPAKFTVKFSGKPKPNYKWFKDDVELRKNSAFECTETADEFQLTIKSCKSQTNSGLYHCKAINNFGESISNKASLTITRAPRFINQPKSTVVLQEQSVRFECLVDALPKAKIQWYLNGRELSMKDNIKIEIDPKTSVNYLIIPRVLQAHLGKYAIRAFNAIGESQHFFDLNVLGKNYYSRLKLELINLT